MIDSDWVRV